MVDEETVAGAIDELAELANDFWLVLEGDRHIPDDDRAEITKLMEGIGEDLDAIRKILHMISESE